MKDDRELRLAVYGFVGEHLGSLCSGHFLFLRELLAKGHKVDFFSIHHTSTGLESFPNFSFYVIEHSFSKRVWRLIDRLPKVLHKTVSLIFAQPSNRMHYSAIKERVAIAHATQPYDAQLFLGLLPPWRVAKLPNIAWSQGCPKGESDWFLRNYSKLFAYGAWHLIPMLSIGYFWKHFESRRDLKLADVVFCGSKWAENCWVRFGATKSKLVPIPYPIDLERFVPTEKSPQNNQQNCVQLLYLGRIVPRKRFDLVLKAFELVAAENEHIRLKVIGNFSYGGIGYKKLMERSAFSERIEYISSIQRQSVPQLIADSDIIIQPSENENYGSACTEAAAMGRPTLLGPTNGTADYLPNASIRFAEYTPESVAQGIRDSIRVVQREKDELARKCRRDAEDFLSPESVTDEILAYIRSAIRSMKDSRVVN